MVALVQTALGHRWVVLIPAAAILGGWLAASAAPRAPSWQVYAIRYAAVPAFPVRYLVTGADTTRTVDIAIMVWLLQGTNGSHVLVDAGFYRQKFIDDWKPANFVTPAEAVRRFGIAPDSISDIIVSHVHWDHMDGIDLFPRARIWIQREEYEYYVGPGGAPLHEAIDTLDAAMFARLRDAGRVKLVEGDGQEILPGITVYTGGKHTYASQYVGVRTAKGTVVVASDNAYLYENLERRRPIAQTLDSTSNLAAQDRMKRMAKVIVPGHDPAVFQRFRTVAPGVVRVQ